MVDSSGVAGEAVALAGAPPIAGIAGDQQASLIGQGCVARGQAKITFGTGGMLDLCLGDTRPAFEMRGEAGCFPIVAWRRAGRITWGAEAFMLTAGQAVEWLRDDLGLIASAAESDALASQCAETGDVFLDAYTLEGKRLITSEIEQRLLRLLQRLSTHGGGEQCD